MTDASTYFSTCPKIGTQARISRPVLRYWNASILPFLVTFLPPSRGSKAIGAPPPWRLMLKGSLCLLLLSSMMTAIS
jgi:hypothetical protein